MPIAFQLLLVIATRETKHEKISSDHESAQENQIEQARAESDTSQGDAPGEVDCEERQPHEPSGDCNDGLYLDASSTDTQLSGADMALEKSPTRSSKARPSSEGAEAVAGSDSMMSENSETVPLPTSKLHSEPGLETVDTRLEAEASEQDSSKEVTKTPFGLGIIDEVYNFIREFNSSQTQNAEQALVNSKDSSGGVIKPSIFEQPGGRGDARIEYEFPLPKVVSDERLILHFSTGLRDGIDLDRRLAKSDGVRFSIEVSGKQCFDGVSFACEWQEHVIDLSEFAGQEIKCAFLTACDGRRSANYNWALWGNPRILKLVHQSLPVERGMSEAKIVRGLAVGRFDDTKRIEEGKDVENPTIVPSSVEPFSIEFAYSSPTSVSQIADEISQRMVGDAETRGYSTELLSKKFELVLYTELPKVELLSLGLTSAMTTVGEDFEVQCKIRNNGLGNLMPTNQASVGINRIKLRRGRNSYPIKVLNTGEETKLVWHIRKFSRESVAKISISLKYRTPIGDVRQTLEKAIDIRPAAPKDSAQILSELHTYNLQEHLVLGNKNLRLLFVQGNHGFQYYTVFAARHGSYRQVATCCAISEVHYLDLKGDRQQLRILPTTYRLVGNSRGQSILILASEQQSSDGVCWSFEASFSLTENDKRVSVEYSLSADRQCQLLAFNGPVLHAGDRSYGESKTGSLFPGLNFLASHEPSLSSQEGQPSYNNRLVPHSSEITVPLMAVEYKNSVVGLAWNPLETSDGEVNLLSAAFASPNWHENQQNHLMGLFVPGLQERIGENSLQSATPYNLATNRKLTIRSHIIVDGNASIVDAVFHWANAYGTPEALKVPRSDEDELMLSRYRFMKTTGNDTSGRSQNSAEWFPGDVPGIATLLWYDYFATHDEIVKKRALAIVESVLSESGPGGLAVSGSCQILKWELPFYFGHVEAVLECLKETIQSLIELQEDDGSWRSWPITENSKNLGQDGGTALGACAHSALMLFKYARITGDQKSLNAGVKALSAMDRFSVPRDGAQASASPLNTPDLLTAAHGVGAYVEAYTVTGENHFLERAEYWAKTGLPFLYHWHFPDRPAMRFASIPVFGMTSSSRELFGVPTQSVGLVFGYYLQQLARHRQKRDWTRIAEGITVSGMYQQQMEGEFKGTYPDGLYESCTEGRAPHVNPENIMVNFYTLRGQDPDISTVVLRNENGRIHLSSGAKIQVSENSNDEGLVFRLKYLENETSYTIIAGFGSCPSGVKVQDKNLLTVKDLDRASSGWLYRKEKDLIFVKYKHADGEVDFEILSSLKELIQEAKDDDSPVVAQPEGAVERPLSQDDATNGASPVDVPTGSVGQDNVPGEAVAVDAQDRAKNDEVADTPEKEG